MPTDWTIKGVVTDKKGNPVEAASISVKGSNAGTKSDQDGKFSLSVPENSTLVISAVGFATREIKVTSEKELSISLEASANDLNEVVVIGYGTQKRSAITSAISTVNTKNLEKQPTANIANMLQGQAAGVSVSTGSGNPAGSPSIQVRGFSSINGGKPLFVVDGIPQDYSYELNPNDVESVSILKDASAGTIYGARSASGVILVTTKKGKSGEPKVNFNYFVGNHKLEDKIKLLDKVSMNRVVKTAYSNDGDNAPAYALDDNKYANTNWKDAYFKKATEQKYDIDVSGGNEKLNYRLSYGHWENNGTIINSGSKRDNIRLNSEIKLLKNRLKITPIMSYTRFNNKNFGDVNGDGNAGYSDIMRLYEMKPHKAVYDPTTPDGFAKPPVELGDGNPVGERMLTDSRTSDDYFQFNLTADLQLYKGLSYNFSVGKTISNTFDFTQTKAYDFGAQAFNENNSRAETRARVDYTVMVHLLNYERSFGDHNFKAMYGFSRDKWTRAGTIASGNKLSSPLIESLRGLIIEYPTDFVRVGGYNSTNTMQSYFGRLSYNYDEKYFLQANYRRDGSSRFAPDYRYGNFWGISGGWALNKEKFFNVPWVDELKIRGSYGELGNQEIGDFRFLNQIFLQGSSPFLNYPFGGKTSQQVFIGAISAELANQAIRWETSGTANYGINFSVLNNKFSGSFDYFQTRTRNMLAVTPVPPSSGVTINPTTNIGSMENQGWEMSLTYRQSYPSGFNFDVTGNLTHTKNKVLKLGSDDGRIIDGAVDFENRYTTLTTAGQTLGAFYMFKNGGIFQNQAEIDAYKNKDGQLIQPNAKPGDLKFLDTNNDGQLTDDDKVIVGSPLPKFEFGLNINASYKNFDFTIFLNGKGGLKMYNGAKMFMYRQYRSTDLENAWTPQNAKSNIYRLSNNDENQNQRVSDYFLEDASFIRLRNIQLGYTLPNDLVRKAYLNRVRVYVGAYNLLTITNYDGFDPDLTSTGVFSRGVDRGYYPLSRSFVAGVNIGF
ncbi:TonB-dependent receptor [Pseudoflavitalea sp. G-6-1-2]|uniref:SusC/RagA family TonB-linked outer membrane protein n=1 Tax=Pseudoflavitalea sp. G-6-1-2 TaxID=2728841 RepID=UPI00146AE939|nr:TonB-dependent receptor [Pseudoflavitalea sp. G-6-1-2]NML23479.1 TonB-dependent receptor [Pseudoflavitalea sp. G-6-1-2]